MKSREEIIAKTFSDLDKHLRRWSIAQIGGFRPNEEPITSWFGGHFVAPAGADWPTLHAETMLPLLLVRTDELPYKPSALDGVALFNVFIGPKELPIDLPAENGEGWLIQTFTSLERLVPLPTPSRSSIRPFPIRWSLSETEGPQWTDAGDLFDQVTFVELDDCIDLFYDRYSQHRFTKVGGWPSFTQDSFGIHSDFFVFQIGSEEKPRWMWGDNGNGYFYFKEGKWFLYWDCY
jgi:hypothetical protein